MPARILDITRLAARAGRGPMTGIDRVEFAYLSALIGRAEPVFGLVRTRFGHGLVGRPALERFRAALLSPGNAAALAPGDEVGRSTPFGLGRLVRNGVPGPAVYYNVGHMGLSDRFLGQLAKVAGLTSAVMIHDTIPLDHPEWNGPGARPRFERHLRAVSRHAGRVICNSAATEADVSRWLASFGRVPPITTAHLGISPAPPEPGLLPHDPDPGRPFFVALGTIEPRKNHRLLLDLWERLHREMAGGEPALLIVGRRGWAGKDLFGRIAALAAEGVAIRELPGLPDGAVSALVQRAAALLMPSFAEGFGLPVGEAAALGTPVVAANLPVYREFAGDYPIYLDSTDIYAWRTTITELAAGSGAGRGRRRVPALPTWDAHFRAVLAPEA